MYTNLSDGSKVCTQLRKVAHIFSLRDISQDGANRARQTMSFGPMIYSIFYTIESVIRVEKLNANNKAARYMMSIMVTTSENSQYC